jgi:hypothetical protein
MDRQMNYNPHELVPMLINGKEFTGRPFEFDSEIADFNKMINSFGELVKPSKLSTVCPDCGAGMMIDVVMGDPPFQPVIATCAICCPDLPPLPDPFNNPLESGRVKQSELDPLLFDSATPVAEDGKTVAERMAENVATQIPDVLPPVPPVVTKVEPVAKATEEPTKPPEKPAEAPKPTAAAPSPTVIESPRKPKESRPAGSPKADSFDFSAKPVADPVVKKAETSKGKVLDSAVETGEEVELDDLAEPDE